MNAEWTERFFRDHPEFANTLTEFMMLIDAAAVLRERFPENGMRRSACAYLDQAARQLLAPWGVTNEFADMLISKRPPTRVAS